jgi:hypothetical protein
MLKKNFYSYSNQYLHAKVFSNIYACDLLLRNLIPCTQKYIGTTNII